MIELENITPSMRMEVTVLGAMLLDAVAVLDASKVLTVNDFSLSSHRTIFRAILTVMQDGIPVDELTVMNELQRIGELKRIGDVSYLAFLTTGIPRNPNIESHVRILKEKSLMNQASVIFSRGQGRVQEGFDNPRIIISEVSRELEKALESVVEEETLEDQGMRTLEAIRRQRSGEQRAFVTSGIEEIDFTHGGFAIGEMTVIGARPGVGKSTILRMAVRANCLKGDFCHLITPEMTADQVLRLFAAEEAGVPFRQIRHADRLSAESLANVEAAMRDIMRWPVKIEEKSPITPAEAISSIRSVKHKHNTKLVGVDYLQKFKYPGKASDRHVHVTDAMVGLSSVAKTEQIAMVAISSLTEPSGREKNRVPTLEDFRQSGDIKYEANTAILMHREVDSETQKLVPECSLIFSKGRSDETGIKKVYFNPDYVKFESHDTYMLRFKP